MALEINKIIKAIEKEKLVEIDNGDDYCQVYNNGIRDAVRAVNRLFKKE